MKKFTIRLSVLSIILFIISYIFSIYAPSYLVSDALLFLPLVFFSITLLNKFIIFKGSNKEHERLIKNYMISLGIKFFLLLSILIAYAFIYPKDSVKFILSFFVFYLIYTLFDSINNFKLFKSSEIKSVTNKINEDKSNNSKEKNQKK